jgi:hypothetical protein
MGILKMYYEFSRNFERISQEIGTSSFVVKEQGKGRR